MRRTLSSISLVRLQQWYTALDGPQHSLVESRDDGVRLRQELNTARSLDRTLYFVTTASFTDYPLNRLTTMMKPDSYDGRPVYKLSIIPVVRELGVLDKEGRLVPPAPLQQIDSQVEWERCQTRLNRMREKLHDKQSIEHLTIDTLFPAKDFETVLEQQHRKQLDATKSQPAPTISAEALAAHAAAEMKRVEEESAPLTLIDRAYLHSLPKFAILLRQYQHVTHRFSREQVYQAALVQTARTLGKRRMPAEKEVALSTELEAELKAAAAHTPLGPLLEPLKVS